MYRPQVAAGCQTFFFAVFLFFILYDFLLNIHDIKTGAPNRRSKDINIGPSKQASKRASKQASEQARSLVQHSKRTLCTEQW
jgi:hypothetical protein